MQERWAHLQVQQQQPPPQLASTVAKNENKFTRGGNNNNKNNNNKRRRQIWPCLFGHLPATFGGKQQHSECCRQGGKGGISISNNLGQVGFGLKQIYVRCLQNMAQNILPSLAVCLFTAVHKKSIHNTHPYKHTHTRTDMHIHVYYMLCVL